MEEGQQPIKVNGKEYPFPPLNLDLGEMCDAEQFFGVDFNAGLQSGMRMAAALLWITIRREDPTVTVDDVRKLPPEIFEALGGDAGPPAEPTSNGGSSSSSADSSSEGSADWEAGLHSSGSPGSDTGATSDPVTSTG